jgi:hypothetical protein
VAEIVKTLSWVSAIASRFRIASRDRCQRSVDRTVLRALANVVENAARYAGQGALVIDAASTTAIPVASRFEAVYWLGMDSRGRSRACSVHQPLTGTTRPARAGLADIASHASSEIGGLENRRVTVTGGARLCGVTLPRRLRGRTGTDEQEGSVFSARRRVLRLRNTATRNSYLSSAPASHVGFQPGDHRRPMCMIKNAEPLCSWITVRASDRGARREPCAPLCLGDWESAVRSHRCSPDAPAVGRCQGTTKCYCGGSEEASADPRDRPRAAKR